MLTTENRWVVPTKTNRLTWIIDDHWKRNSKQKKNESEWFEHLVKDNTREKEKANSELIWNQWFPDKLFNRLSLLKSDILFWWLLLNFYTELIQRARGNENERDASKNTFYRKEKSQFRSLLRETVVNHLRKIETHTEGHNSAEERKTCVEICWKHLQTVNLEAGCCFCSNTLALQA